MYGAHYSKATVSNMTKVVDEQVQAFQQRRLPSQYAAIFLDANYLPLKRDTVQKEAVHCIQPTWLRTLTSISNATPTTKNNFQRKIHWIDSWFLSLMSTTRSPWSESIADSTDFRTPWKHHLFKLDTYYMYEGISFTQDSWRYPFSVNYDLVGDNKSNNVLFLITHVLFNPCFAHMV